MSPHRVHGDTEHVSNLPTAPPKSVNEEHRNPLPLGQQRQRLWQPGLYLRHGESRHRSEYGPFGSSSNTASPDLVQVPDRILHLLYSLPVLPAVGQCFGGRLASPLLTQRGRQSEPEPRLRLSREVGEGLLLRGFGCYCRPPYLLNKGTTAPFSPQGIHITAQRRFP